MLRETNQWSWNENYMEKANQEAALGTSKSVALK
jgi:hypothetical protein